MYFCNFFLDSMPKNEVHDHINEILYFFDDDYTKTNHNNEVLYDSENFHLYVEDGVVKGYRYFRFQSTERTACRIFLILMSKKFKIYNMSNNINRR